MVFTPLEIIALLFVILGLVKLLVVLVKRELWFRGVVKPIYGNSKIAAPVFAVLALVIFFFLIQELNIVEIFAALAFSAFFIGVGFATVASDMLPTIKKLYVRKFSWMTWVYTLLWLILSFWVLWVLFG